MNTPILRMTLNIGLAATTPLSLQRTVDLPQRLDWSLVAEDTPAVAVSDPVMQTLADALARQGVQAQGEAPPCTLPMPWARCCPIDPPLPTPSEQCLMAVAYRLGLLPVDNADWKAYRNLLQEHAEQLADDLREAMAFWLITEGRFTGDTPETIYWTQDRRQVLVLRDVKLPRRRPVHPWLILGYRLLKGLIGLRRRIVAPSLNDYSGLLDALASEDTAPLAFQQALWWEAHYRLSETGQHAEADEALNRYQRAAMALNERLPGLIGRDGMGIGVVMGRQAYYQGHYETALGHYLNEWEKVDAFRKPRLKRLTAGLLSDMFYLDTARRLAREATQEEYKVNIEDYKSAGRLGEAELRCGDYPVARRYYLLSLDFQSKHFGTEHIDGQTYTYLGHVFLLEGKWAEAARYYQQAEAADRNFNVYTLMGRIALEVRRQSAERARTLYARYRTELKTLESDPVKALPLGVIMAGLFLLAPEEYREMARAALTRMIAANYAIEALYLLRILCSPKEAKTFASKIQPRLRAWDEAIQKLPAEWRSGEEHAAHRPTPAYLSKTLTKALKTKNGSWAELDSYLPQIYPMNLLGQFEEIKFLPNHCGD
jgi:tetratricopeptide (TPR) repeat protein